jgi:orotate phosphoribosyltransferase
MWASALCITTSGSVFRARAAPPHAIDLSGWTTVEPPGYRRLGMNRIELASRILRASHLTGEFRLRSGATSGEYFDKYQFEAIPALLRAVATQLVPLVPAGTQVLAGLELGGVALATALSLTTGLPAAFVRKVAKSYGTCQLAEGASIAGRRVLVVEDVVTSGGQIVESTAQLRSLGAEVATALCVIDREAGGRQALALIDLTLIPLFTKTDLDRVQ